MANTFLPKFGKQFLNFRPVLSLYCLSRAKGRRWTALVSVHNGVRKTFDDKKLVIRYYPCCRLLMTPWIIRFRFYQFRIISNAFLLTYNVIEGLAPSGKGRSRGFLQWTSIASRGSSFALSLSMLLKPCKLAPEALRVSLLQRVCTKMMITSVSVQESIRIATTENSQLKAMLSSIENHSSMEPSPGESKFIYK